MKAQTICSVPVALIIFNRPDLTRRVFKAIRRAQPRQLFIIADGPRNAAEEKLCQQAREAVGQVDWKCEVQTNFSSDNLGCGRRPATGIDWVFSHVDQAIILEDDCLPAPTFFSYCESLLGHYRDNPRIMHISGDNYLRHPPPGYSYHFSKYTFSCGWATWRRAWKCYDFELATWPKFKKTRLREICPDPVEAAYWSNKFDPIYEGKRSDAWDYQWNYAVWARGGLSILPSVNLIENIGFRADATHTREWDARANLPAGEITHITHPRMLDADAQLDARLFDEILGGGRLRQRRTWRHRLSKPLRVYAKWRNEKAATR